MRRIVGLWLCVLLAIALCSRAQAQGGGRALVELRDATGAVVGTLTLTQEDAGVRLTGNFSNLPVGDHGIHVHAVGSCAPDFAAAGPHFNPASKQHGTQNPNGPHAGDLPNLTVSADGTGTYDQVDAMISLAAGSSSVFDADGSAVVVHAAPDDYMTDPSGNSGARIACGAVVQTAGGIAPAPAPVPQELPNTGMDHGGSLALLLATALAGIVGLGVRRQAQRRR